MKMIDAGADYTTKVFLDQVFQRYSGRHFQKIAKHLIRVGLDLKRLGQT
jgi:hypothetical protein